MGLVGRVLKGRRAMEDRMVWVGRVLEGCTAMEWVGLEGSLKVVDTWNGLSWKGP